VYVFTAHQLFDAGDMVGIHPAGDEGRHAQGCGTGLDLGSSANSHYFSPEKKFIVSIRKASTRLFHAQLSEINLR
jgi:hypothetical protein